MVLQIQSWVKNTKLEELPWWRGHGVSSNCRSSTAARQKLKRSWWHQTQRYLEPLLFYYFEKSLLCYLIAIDVTFDIKTRFYLIWFLINKSISMTCFSSILCNKNNQLRTACFECYKVACLTLIQTKHSQSHEMIRHDYWLLYFHSHLWFKNKN